MALSFAASLVSATLFIKSTTGSTLLYVAVFAFAVLLVLGMISSVSRRVAISRGDQIAMRIAGIVWALGWIMTPVLMLQAVATRWLSRGTRTSPPRDGDVNIDLSLDSDGEPLDEHEVKMIRAVVKLDKTTAREIMVPRVDIVAALSGTNVEEVAEQMVSGGHSRIPIYNGTLDNIEGVVHARDVIGKIFPGVDSPAGPVDDIMRPPLFIPESKTLEELLTEFQQGRVHMAIVIDEYGGVSGLVTIEDLLEEIVGEIQDEFDTGEMEVESINDNEFIIDARVSIDDLNELLGLSVESDGFDTVGGFVYDRLGKIPSAGDSLTHDGLSIEVISTSGRRLDRLKVTKVLEHDTTRTG